MIVHIFVRKFTPACKLYLFLEKVIITQENPKLKRHAHLLNDSFCA